MAAGARLGRWLWAVAALVVLVLVLKVFVADVYRVSSGSMRPTIFAGPVHPGEEARVEWVLVAYERGRVPERFDLVVWDRAGVGAVVKRVVGLPDEEILIQDGDLLVNGERLGPLEPRPVPVVVFDSRLAPVEDYFHFRGEDEGGPWRHDGERWIVDARAVPQGDYLGTMSYHPELRDDFLDHEGRRVVGRRTINDVAFECEFQILGGEGRLRVTLLEKADAFELLVTPVGEHYLRVTVTRRSVAPAEAGEAAGREPEVLAEEVVEVPAGEPQRLRFWNRDDHLSVELPDVMGSAEGNASRFGVTYEGNRLLAGRAPAADHHVGPRVEFGAEGLEVAFRGVRILRDLHYTAPDEGHGVGTPVHLGPEEVFLLGDNSTQSQDSREFGPVPLEELVGEPTHVLWPPSMARRLVARAAP